MGARVCWSTQGLIKIVLASRFLIMLVLAVVAESDREKKFPSPKSKT
ncbi:hypothetical protein K9N68_09600 [Kovacikia minuta CCNUW1]|nr:hypothetical protein [Kovacikia minuta]UBF28108.1 hypothetical protein K9N68_09600 [Kovacikia minuta CCNUW1]